MAVGALELKFWQVCCDVLQRPDLKDQHWMCGMAPNSARSNALKAELDTIFAGETLSYWTSLFAAHDCCVTPVLQLEEALTHPLFVARQMVRQAEHETEGRYWQLGAGIRFSS